MTDSEITIQEAAQLAGVTPEMAWRAVHQGKLAAVFSERLGRLMTTPQAVEAWRASARRPGRPRKNTGEDTE